MMEDRRGLVEKMIAMMEKGKYRNASAWNKAALMPYNPVSKVRYRGGNCLRLMFQVQEKGYQDARWMTANQLKKEGFYIKKGERGVICEKWTFEKEKKVLDQITGKTMIEKVPLEHPVVSYFKVFNGEQVKDYPPFQEPQERVEGIAGKIADISKAASECPIIECAQPKSYYSPGMDKIVLPLRSMFKDEESRLAVQLHEMIHSTGHSARLARNLSGGFGTEAYAREELCAELGVVFLTNDLNISLREEHYEDRSDYLKSWIRILRNDYNELFRIAADADRAAQRISQAYRSKELEFANPELMQEREQKKVTAERKKLSLHKI